MLNGQKLTEILKFKVYCLIYVDDLRKLCFLSQISLVFNDFRCVRKVI
jgi:hypothetical protein